MKYLKKLSHGKVHFLIISMAGVSLMAHIGIVHHSMEITANTLTTILFLIDSELMTL